MRTSKFAFRIFASTLFACSALLVPAFVQEPHGASLAAPPVSGSSNDSVSSAPYMRLDFQVKGVSCVACIRRVAKGLKNMKGVVKADVSIYYPHWAVVILDKSKADETKVIQTVRKEKVDVTRMTKQDLKEVPALVVPHPAGDEPKRM